MPPSFVLSLTPPLDFAETLAPYRRSGDDLIDRWDGTRLLRTTRLDDRVIAWRAHPGGDAGAPSLEVTTDVPLEPAYQAALAAAIRGTFVPASHGWSELVASDPVLRGLDARYPGLRPVLQPDLLTALIRSISAQQVNLAWAATTRRRLAEAFGDRYEVEGEPVYRLSPARLADASPDAIRALQFTTAKARSIVDVAAAIGSGRVDEAALRAAPDEDVIAQLIALRGIGLWSAEWILARTFGRPRVVAGDLGVRKAVAHAYLRLPIAPESDIRRATAHWGAGATLAQALLLRTLVP